MDDKKMTQDDPNASPLEAARAAIKEHRYERAQALAAVAQALALADIANALRDDDGNNPAHILHNMSYNIDVIASCVASAEARGENAAIYGS